MGDSVALVPFVVGTIKALDTIAQVIAPVLERKLQDQLIKTQAEIARKITQFFTKPLKLKKLNFRTATRPKAKRSKSRIPFRKRRGLSTVVRRRGRQRGVRRGSYSAYRGRRRRTTYRLKRKRNRLSPYHNRA